MVNSDPMHIVARVVIFLALAGLLLGVSPLAAQVAAPEYSPSEASDSGVEGITPPRVPLLGPQDGSERPDEGVKMDGRVRVVYRRSSDFRWIYRIENGSQERVGTFTLVVPDRWYDSRIVPESPYGWVERRERGEGDYKDGWAITWAASTHTAALRPGKRMEIALVSAAQLLVNGRSGHLMGGRAPLPPNPAALATVSGGAAVPVPSATPYVPPSTRMNSAWPVLSVENARPAPPRLLFPWDDAYVSLGSLLTDAAGKSTGPSVVMPYPALSFLPVPSRVVDIPTAVAAEEMTASTHGQGVHSGRVFQMTVRSPHHVVAVLKRGTVLVPSLPPYDVFIVGRTERLAMAPNDTATIAVRGYSITYGKKVPPPRVVLHNLVYRFASGPPPKELETYEKIVGRISRLVPVLDTPLTDRYLDTVVQWAVWRAQRLMAANPLSIRDLERDLSQTYAVRWTTKGPVRDYLQPLEIYQLARRVWSDSDVLLADEPVPVIP